MSETKMMKKIFTAVWVAVMLFMFYVIYVTGFERQVWITSFVVAFFVAALIKIRRMKDGNIRTDERINKLSAYATTYSWFLALMTVILLYWIDYAGFYPLTVSLVTWFLLTEMAVSAAFFKWILLRRGDVE